MFNAIIMYSVVLKDFGAKLRLERYTCATWQRTKLSYLPEYLRAASWNCGFRRRTDGRRLTTRSTSVHSWLGSSQHSWPLRRQTEPIAGRSGANGRAVAPASAASPDSGLVAESVFRRPAAAAVRESIAPTRPVLVAVWRVPLSWRRCRKSPVSSEPKRVRRWWAKGTAAWSSLKSKHNLFDLLWLVVQHVELIACCAVTADLWIS